MPPNQTSRSPRTPSSFPQSMENVRLLQNLPVLHLTRKVSSKEGLLRMARRGRLHLLLPNACRRRLPRSPNDDAPSARGGSRASSVGAAPPGRDHLKGYVPRGGVRSSHRDAPSGSSQRGRSGTPVSSKQSAKSVSRAPSAEVAGSQISERYLSPDPMGYGSCSSEVGQGTSAPRPKPASSPLKHYDPSTFNWSAPNADPWVGGPAESSVGYHSAVSAASPRGMILPGEM